MQSIEAADHAKIPSELLKELHDATERFHQTRQTWEGAGASMELDHEKFLSKAAEELHAAEKALEAVHDRVHQHLSSLETKHTA